MQQLSVRLTDQMFGRLDALAEERGLTRTRLVRQILAVALDGAPVEGAEPPSEDELLALLTEKARQGNVAAIRTLLLREEQQDPRSRAIAVFRGMVEERRQ